MYYKDYDPIGFEWINNISADENMLVFMRRGRVQEEDLLVVCNFSPLVYEDHKIGVPYSGKYKEIFNSDSVEFGGDGNTNPRVKVSKKSECDERENSIRVLVPPMGISIFKCTPHGRRGSAGKGAPRKETAFGAGEESGALNQGNFCKRSSRKGNSRKENRSQKDGG